MIEGILEFDAWIRKNEIEFILKPIGNFFKDLGVVSWQWFVENLPDIMGYGGLVAGGAIIIGAMVGKGGMIKPLAIYAGGLIAATLILGSN